MATGRGLRFRLVGVAALAVAVALVVRHEASARKRSAYERVMRETSVDSLRAHLPHARDAGEILRRRAADPLRGRLFRNRRG